MSNEQIYETHIKTVYGFFMSKTWDRQTAEDLTSEVFTTAFEQFRNPSKTIEDKEKYLYGIMKLTWLGYLREKYKRLEDATEDIEDFAEYVEDNLGEIRERSLIDRALPFIQQLPEKQQIVLLLRFRDGLSIKEICAQLEKNTNYVKTTQKRGLASLKLLVKGELA